MGRYEIVASLGAGGMGEVYRARDSRLGRSVAIKVLRGGLAQSDELSARFRREAEAIAALKHPHICVLYDVGESDGVDYLVMEHLEGETLAQRLARGPLTIAQTLEHGIEIASALAAAHRHGIVHRDLKPGNVMLTPIGAKVLDFGLAKPVGGDRLVIDTVAATEMAPVTVDGAIVGTIGYMAPEQLEGRPADARSDLFAMGAILYEAVTGKRAFEAPSQAGLIAAVMSTSPDATVLERAGAPPLLRKVVFKCLAKDPEKRWQNADDLLEALRWSGEREDSTRDAASDAAGPTRPGQTSRGPSRYRAVAIAASALALILAALLSWQILRPRPTPSPSAAGPIRLSIAAPPGTTLTPLDATGVAQFALSPDGSRIVFVANRRGERPQLWVRSFASGDAVPLTGTEDPRAPFWSPDGADIGFFAHGKLERVSVDGAGIRHLADTAGDSPGGTWSSEGVILFAAGALRELYRVSADGGPVEKVTTLDPSRQELGHRFPQFLPDGRRFLVEVLSKDTSGYGIDLGTLDSNTRQQLLLSSVAAVYAEPGYLLFYDNGQFSAQPFDLESGKLEQRPMRLADRVFGVPPRGLLSLSAANNGTLAYWEGDLRRTELVWLDRAGREVGRFDEETRGLGFALSADGRQVAFHRFSEKREDDLWRIDGDGQASRLTFSANASFPIWSPDGKSLMCSSRLKLGRIDAGAGTETMIEGTPLGVFAEDWSRDGRWVLYTSVQATGWDIGAVDLESGQNRIVVETPADQAYARLSPNGRWLAYASDETGVFEVFVRPFPDGPGRRQISTAGGSRPVWSADGRELFYIDARGELFSVPVESSESFASGKARSLFYANLPPVLAPYRSNYAVAPDGERFLLERIVPDQDPSTITVVLDWPAALKDTRPTAKR